MVAALLAVGLLAAGVQAASSGRPALAAATASGPRFGLVDGGLLSDTPAQLDAALSDANRIGVTWLRAQLSWAATEPSPGAYRWAAFDRLVQAAAAHHLSVLALVDFTPAWAAPAGCQLWMCAPADPGAFAAFAGTAAARYAPRGVHTWEVWNEPNSRGFWAPRADSAAYTSLLEATARSIRRADPGAFIVSGGLAPEPDANGNISPVKFLQAVCSSGALAAVDAVGVHPYSYPVPPDYPAAWNAWQQMADTSVSERSVMTACGAGGKQLWATEYGAPTGGPGAEATASNLDLAAHPDHVDENLQAAMATASVRDTRADPWLGALFWYSGQDAGTASTTNENFFGLRRYDGSAKPAWAALQAAMTAP